jgi:phage-related protein
VLSERKANFAAQHEPQEPQSSRKSLGLAEKITGARKSSIFNWRNRVYYYGRQIVPEVLDQLSQDGSPVRCKRSCRYSRYSYFIPYFIKIEPRPSITATSIALDSLLSS